MNYVAKYIVIFIFCAWAKGMVASNPLLSYGADTVTEIVPSIPTLEVPSFSVESMHKDLIFGTNQMAMWHAQPYYDLDQIADYYFEDTLPPALRKSFPFLNADILNLQNKAGDFIDQLGEAGRLLEALTGLEKVKFPVGMQKKYDNGLLVAIGIERMEFDGAVAKFINIFLKLEVPGAPALIFGAPIVTFTRTGGFVEATLGLIGDLPIPINGSAETMLLLKGYNRITNQGCVARISCNGFESATLSAAVYLSRNLVYPVDSRGGDTGGYVNGHFDLTVSDLRDFLASVSFDQPFKVRGSDKVIFSVNKATFDGSEINSLPDLPFPDNYFASGDDVTYNQWQGVFIEELGIQLDRFYDLKTEDEFGIDVHHLFIDRYGVTGVVGANNLLSLDKGNIGVARISIERLEVELLKSKPKRLAVNGRVTAPNLDENNNGRAIRYIAEVTDNAWHANALIEKGDTLDFPAFNNALVLFPGTTLYIGKSDQSEETVVQVNLCGKVDPSKVLPGGGDKQLAGAESDSSGIYFENFTVQSTSPTIKNIGNWSIPRQEEIPLGPLKFTLAKVATGQTPEGEVLFHFEGGASFSKKEGFNISSNVGLNIFAKYDAEQKLRYDRTEVEKIALCVAAKSWGAYAELFWFDDHPIYGSGVGGRAAVSLASMGYIEGDGCDFNSGIFANAIFGEVDTTRFYNFELLYLNLEHGISMGPLALHGIGGAITNRMEARGVGDINFATVDVQDTSAIYTGMKNQSFGKSLFGTTYTPKSGVGFKISLMTIAASGGSSNIINMNAFMSINFNPDGGLDSIRLDVAGQMFSRISLEVIKSDNVPVFFEALILYDHVNKIFLLDADVDIDVKNKMYGGGELTLKVDGKSWYLHVGRPLEAGNVGIVIPAIGLETNAYFAAGNHNVPDIPPLPAPIRAVFGDPDPRDYSVVDDLAGLAFGAHFSLGNPKEREFLMFYYKLHVLVGMDINLRNYAGYSCDGDPDFGIRQWYGKGQVYAYVDGAVGLHAGGRRFPILELMTALKIYLEAPNPIYGEFGIAVKFNVLGGLVKGRAKIEASFGDKCQFAKDNIDINVFDDIITPENEQPLHVAQDITFSSGVPFNRSWPDEVGVSEFQIKLTDNLQDYRGQTSHLDFEEQGFAFYQTNGTTHSIPCRKIYTEGNTFITYVPEETWPANSQIWIHPEAHFSQSLDRGRTWQPIEDASGQRQQDTIYHFTTGDYPAKVPPFNIDYSYPANGMSNYYMAQNNEEGIIKLKKGMHQLFAQKKILAEIVSHSPGAVSFSSECKYNVAEKSITWDMPVQQLMKEAIYSISFVSEGKDIIDPIHFRCSAYETIEDKIANAFGTTDPLRPIRLLEYRMPNTTELFDELEMNGNAMYDPALDIEYDLDVLQDPNKYPRVPEKEVKNRTQIDIYMSYHHNLFAEGFTPQIVLETPDQLGEIPSYNLPQDVNQYLKFREHEVFVDILLEKCVEYGYFDLNSPYFSRLFGDPNEFQTLDNFNSTTNTYDDTYIDLYDLSDRVRSDWRHPPEVKIRWIYRIGDLILSDNVETYNVATY